MRQLRRRHLSTDRWPEGYARKILTRTDSTNAEAARLAPVSSGPIWILAHEQQAAKGRRGRLWSMPKGNFAATLLMHPTEKPGVVALRSFVASLALFDALVAVSGRSEPFSLKWPNDVLLSGQKLAGILLESIGSGTGVQHLAIGIGVNLASAPDIHEVEAEALRPVALSLALGVAVGPEDFLILLAESYAKGENDFVTLGFAPIRHAWLERAARLGEIIRARTVTEEHIGRFETLDEDGNLVLGTANGRKHIPAAEVFF